MNEPRIAVLGTGIMGSSVALFLARSGVRVTMFDRESEPFRGASRWNEGKIHLGHLYAADSSMETVTRLLPGGLAFKRLTEELIGRTLDDLVSTRDEIYLIHRDSVVDADEFAAHATEVARLAANHAHADDYFVDLTAHRPHRVSPSEIAASFDTDAVTAAFRVPERSVRTSQVADAFVAALNEEGRIDIILDSKVVDVVPTADTLEGPLLVEIADGTRWGPFDGVVNALWEGRLAIDSRLGLRPQAPWSHRYRLAVFATTSEPVEALSAVIAVGPFGDIKAYGPHDFYLSWYPAGLVVEGSETEPPPLPQMDSHVSSEVARKTFDALGAVIPSVAAIEAADPEISVEGGWVYAIGQGPLGLRESTLHRRDKIGADRVGSYVTVDTGKYSIAPWLARRLVDDILSG